MITKRKVSRGSFMGVITGRSRGAQAAGNDVDLGGHGGGEGKPDDPDKAPAAKGSDADS